MRALRSLLQCSARERLWLAEVALWLWAVRLGLWLLPFRQVQRAVTWCARPALRVSALPAERVGWAVVSASLVVPAATCLVHALVGQLLLGQRGCPALLRIGVTRGERGRIEAHAWLEQAGIIVLGGPPEHVVRYTILQEGAE